MNMKIAENTQERLEELWIATYENGQEITLQPDEGDEELVSLGLVERIPDGITLTPSGKVEAAQAVRRHRLAERLLSDVLTTEEALVDSQACGLEHALFDGLDESICTLLGHPTVCPHGKPIPPGRCCLEMRASVTPLIKPLDELRSGEQGQIAYIHATEQDHLQKLMAMGVLPGVAVHVIRTSPSYVFEAGYSQFAVDQEVASGIYVRLKNNKK
jgi:DtxR family Mn-dependent transcriptional regulator